MEVLEVQSKDFLVKWINCPENSTINWQIKPLKRSINFAIYLKLAEAIRLENKARAQGGSQLPTSLIPPSIPPPLRTDAIEVDSLHSTDSKNGLKPPTRPDVTRSGSLNSVNKITDSSLYRTRSSRLSTFSVNLNKPGLTLVKDYGRLISNEVVRGDYTVTKGGVYAFVFDNSFSKTTGKKVYFSSKISGSPTVKFFSESAKGVDGTKQLGATDVAFSSALATAAAEATAAVTAITGEYALTKDRSVPLSLGSDTDILTSKNGELLQGILSKRRRKRMQGSTKRFFILNLKYGMLSYFKLNNNKLRGQMPITRSIVSANSKTRQIFIDSGMEVWELKAVNSKGFDAWVEAFNIAKKLSEGSPHLATPLSRESVLAGTQRQEDRASYDAHDITQSLEELIEQHGSEMNPDILKAVTEISLKAAQLSKTMKNRKRLSTATDTTSLFSTSQYFDAQDHDIEDGVVLLDMLDEFPADEKYTGPTTDISSEERSLSSISSSGEESIPDANSETATIAVRLCAKASDLASLYPLPHEPVERDSDIPICNHTPPSIIGFVRKNVGKDLSTIAMPVEMNEPLGVLQRYAEIFEYSQLLNDALTPDFARKPEEQILRIAAFAVSYMSSFRAKERNNRKPFNPLLGETFELVREDFGLRMVGEKVSHRPAVFAYFAETSVWKLTFCPAPTQKFWGKTAEVKTLGEVCLTVKSTGETFHWSYPNTLLKNIIAGEKYTEPSSQVIVKSSDGLKAVTDFAKGGMFSGRSEDLEIKAYNSSREELPYNVCGKWTESMILNANSTEKVIWNAGNLLQEHKKKFGYTEFAGTLNKITEMERGQIPATDSRLRPDLKAYEEGDVTNAERLKVELEEAQRERRKVLEESGTRHKAQFFERVSEDSDYDWKFIEGSRSYWVRRENGDWDDLVKLW